MEIWEKTKGFVKKHKTGLLVSVSTIGAAVGGYFIGHDVFPKVIANVSDIKTFDDVKTVFASAMDYSHTAVTRISTESDFTEWAEKTHDALMNVAPDAKKIDIWVNSIRNDD